MLVEAAGSVGWMKDANYLAAQHAHVRSRRGVAKAIGATRHDLLIAYWHIVHDNVDCADPVPDWAYRTLTRARIRKLVTIGQTVTLGPAA